MQTRCLLALRQHQLRATPNRCTVIRRSFGTDVLIHPVTSLSQAYLTFGSVFQSIPLPEFLPPHAAAIIAATIVLRTCVTLPLTIWSRRRVRRFRDEVLPRLKDAKLQYAREFRELKKEKNAKLAEELFHDFKSQYQPKLAAYYARLVEYHSCSPLKTLLIPIAMHFPVFIVSSLALREASVPPTPLLYETFLSEASLAQSDTFGFFPIAIGVTSLINFEVSRRFFSPLRGEQPKMTPIVDNVVRGASLVVVAAGMMAPNSVTLYWLTSSFYTLGQTIVLGFLDKSPRPLEMPPLERNTLPRSSLNNKRGSG